MLQHIPAQNRKGGNKIFTLNHEVYPNKESEVARGHVELGLDALKSQTYQFPLRREVSTDAKLSRGGQNSLKYLKKKNPGIQATFTTATKNGWHLSAKSNSKIEPSVSQHAGPQYLKHATSLRKPIPPKLCSAIVKRFTGRSDLSNLIFFFFFKADLESLPTLFNSIQLY